MKKYKYYIILLLALLVIAVVLYVKDKPGTLKTSSKIFAVTDTTDITRIKISDGTTDLVLEKTGNNWQVNNSFNARPRAVKGLMHVISSLEIYSPVPKSARQEIMKNFSHYAVFVSVESAKGLVKAYKITEEDSMKLGSIMMLKDDDEPYVVRLPGFEGRISRLIPLDARIWRDKTIFSYKPEDILSIDVEYPDNPKASFIYSFSGPNNIEIKSNTLKQSIKISRETAKDYLAGYTSVSYLEQLNEQAKTLNDSLKKQNPYCKIQIKNTSNQIVMVKAYRIPIPQQKGKFNFNKMYAVIQNDTIPVLVKYVDFDPIMKEYSDFHTQ